MPRQQTLFSMPQTEMTSDDYYTPAWIFDALKLTFDIDVASPPGGIDWIPARRYFTLADDGLSQPWQGLIYMNPPYSSATEWVRRFIEHGNGIALLPVVKTRWFISLWEHQNTRNALLFDPGSTDLNFIKLGKEKRIMWQCLIWGLGDEAIKALENLGKVR